MTGARVDPAGRPVRPAADGRPEPIPSAVWTVAVVVVLGAFMTQLDSALVNIGLASIADRLHSSLPTAQWIVTGYLIGLGVGLPLCGWCCRRYGAGRVWLVVLAAFTVLSGLCAAAPTMDSLIAFRCLQGFAGGLLLPAGQMIIAQAAGRGAMGRVMSVVGTALVLAPALGPVVGSWMIAHLSWPWLFLINLPVGAIALAAGSRLIPLGDRAPAQRFDTAGFLLIGLALPLVAYAIGQFGTVTGSGWVRPAVLLLIGLLLLAAFVRPRSAGSARLLNLAVFAEPRFRSAAVMTLLVGMVQFGALVAWPLYLQILAGFGVVESGLLMLGFAVGSAFLVVSGRLTDRLGGAPVCVAGSVLMALSFLPAAAGAADRSRPAIEIGLLVLGVGSAMSVVPASTAAYVATPPERMSDAVTVINILLRVGGVIGAALVVAIIGSQSLHSTVDPARFHATFWALAAVAAAALLTSLWMVAVSRTGAGRRP